MSWTPGYGHVVRGAGGAGADRTITTAVTELAFGFESCGVIISNDGTQALRVWLDKPTGATPAGTDQHSDRPYITIAAGSGLPLEGHKARSIWVAAAAATTTVEVIAYERGG